MMWHKCFCGDFPEDHVELINAKREIIVLAVDSEGVYSVELREYVPILNGYTWHSRKRNIEAWTEIIPYD